MVQVGGLDCVTASPNCGTLLGTDFEKCFTCNSGYGLNPTTELCVDCTGMANCAQCNHDGTNILCTTCDATFTPTADQLTCAASIDNCQALDSGNPLECETCVSGYGQPTARTTCVTCDDATVTDVENCNTCDITFTPYTATCTGCADGYELENGECVQVCITFDGDRCTECSSSPTQYYLDEESGECVTECPEGTTLVDTTCTSADDCADLCLE